MPNRAAKQRKRMKKLATKKIAEYKAMIRRNRKDAKRQEY